MTEIEIISARIKAKGWKIAEFCELICLNAHTYRNWARHPDKRIRIDLMVKGLPVRKANDD